jgi:hypothetical protein
MTLTKRSNHDRSVTRSQSLASLAIWTIFSAPVWLRKVTTGTIVGMVTDAGGVVPGANVTTTEVNRGTSDTFVTDSGRRLHRAVPTPVRIESK